MLKRRKMTTVTKATGTLTEKQSASTKLKRAPHINILSGTEEEQTSVLYLTTEDKGMYMSVL